MLVSMILFCKCVWTSLHAESDHVGKGQSVKLGCNAVKTKLAREVAVVFAG